MKNLLPGIALVIFFCSTCFLSGFSQDSIGTAPAKLKKWELKGYVKNLQTFDIGAGPGNVLSDDLIHNRLNLRWYPVTGLTIDVELRTRLYLGTLVKATPGFGDSLNNNSNDIYKMSALVVNEPSLVLQTMLDRVFVDYTTGKWDFRLGRQRINWGINLVWNPNDIFNAYSFYDFDYEEHRGSDAGRITYYIDNTSSIEIAAKVAETKNQVVAAALYKFNRRQYDFQFLGGVANTDAVAGWGWAGHISGAAFKGEMSYFQPYSKLIDTVGSISGSLSIDNVFKHNWELNVSILYNSGGTLHANLGNITALNISAKNLYPYRYSVFSMVSYPVTPLLNTSLALIYSPAGDNAVFINPDINYSLTDNLDIDLVGQLFVASFNGNHYGFQGEAIYGRLKFSF